MKGVKKTSKFQPVTLQKIGASLLLRRSKSMPFFTPSVLNSLFKFHFQEKIPQNDATTY
jgi:hypothetical protein